MQKLPFDHKKENLLDACSITEEDIKRVLNNPFEAELPYLLRVTSLLATFFVGKVIEIPHDDLTPLARIFRFFVVGTLAAFNTKVEIVQFIEEKIVEILPKENLSMMREVLIEMMYAFAS